MSSMSEKNTTNSGWVCSVAYMELYAVLAFIFSHFELEPVDKDQSQKGIQWADRIVARSTSSLRIKVVKDRWE
jgi:hypothetical protein